LQLCRIARMRSATIHVKQLIKTKEFFERSAKYKLRLKYSLMLAGLNVGEVKERKTWGNPHGLHIKVTEDIMHKSPCIS
jgi:hypothetical protein